MPYTVLSHTADTGIEATAATFSALVCDLATGMFGLMANPTPCTADHMIDIAVEAAGYEDLVVDVLSELLYQSEVEDLFLCRFEVQAIDRLSLHISASGVANTAVELTGPPIKAVTYHDVAVTQTDDGWQAKVYFDV